MIVELWIEKDLIRYEEDIQNLDGTVVLHGNTYQLGCHLLIPCRVIIIYLV